MNLVALRDVVPSVVLDLRYATDRNVLGEVLYDPNFVAQLDEPAAQALAKATEYFMVLGYSIVLWDAYRTPAVHQRLLTIEQPEPDMYIVRDSEHCKGLAVDVTLATNKGEYLDMGTDHDDFSPRAHRDAEGLTQQQQTHRQLLLDGMAQAGFEPMATEWWHFNYTGA